MLSRIARLRLLRLQPTATPITSGLRGYATPVNPSSSVDALLGTSVPPPPREGQEFSSAPGTYSTPSRFGSKDPNDISDLLHGNTRQRDPTRGSFSNNGRTRESILADLQRFKGTAIGAERKGIPIPSRDEMLEEMFKRPLRELEERRNIVDREHPHPIDALYGRNELDEKVLAAARALYAASTNPSPRLKDAADTYKAASLGKLVGRFEARSGYQLSIELPYESTPSEERKVPLTSAHSSEAELEEANDDGVLLLAYVSNLNGARGTERISVCSGFAVEGGDKISAEDGDGKGALVVSCAHTLRAAEASKPKTEANFSSNTDTEPSASVSSDSIALAITRTGAIYPVRNLISSLPTSNVILLQLGTTPLTLNASSSPTQPIRTLPVSPYPAYVNSELSVSSFWGWEDDFGAILPAYTYDYDQQQLSLSPPSSSSSAPPGREKEQVKLERDDAGRSRWGRARLVEYKDPCGASAMVGTYDELAQLDYKLLVSSPANPPALQGDYALRLSSTVSEASRPASLANGSGGSGAGKESVVGSQTRKPLPNFPPPGSSGGPVVDVESGSVVGIVRGHKMSSLEGRRGDAVPAEKVFEFFALPGLGRKN